MQPSRLTWSAGLWLASLICLSSTGFVTAAEEPRPLYVECYAGQVSYAPGEDLTLHVSTSAATFSAEILRLGVKAESVWTSAAVAGREHPVPEDASSHGCRWPAAVTLKIPAEWRSGYYQVSLRARDGGGRFVQRNTRTAEGTCYFVLRSGEPGKASKVLLQLSTHTYNAYNNWGGFSLYAFQGRDGNQGHRVSSERPPSSLFGSWERPFVEWAERNGFTFDYAANSDLEFHPEILKAYRLVLSVGHDEYWSSPMRDNLEKFIGEGGNVAFFSGNTCCWQVRSEDGGKALTCWKQNYPWDPVYGARGSYATLSSLWSHHLVNRPENQLTGVGFLWGGYHKSHGQLMDASGAYTVHRPEHWLFAGTGLERDDTFGAKDTIVGYECDGCQLEWKDGLPSPTHRDGTPDTFEVLASAPAQWHPDDCQWYDQWENGRKGNAVLGLYTRGGTVFTCGQYRLGARTARWRRRRGSHHEEHPRTVVEMNGALRAAVVGVAMASASARALPAEPAPSGYPSSAAALSTLVPAEMRFGVLPARAPERMDNPSTTAKIELGRLLFFDPILSSTKDVSCATCHNPRLGWTDRRAAPIGVGGTGIGPTRTFRGPASLPLIARNVPTILNVGFNGLVSGTPPAPATAPMFWDSRLQEGLERQVFAPMTSLGEMRGEECPENEAVARTILRVRSNDEYRARFQAAFESAVAGEAVSPEHLAQAIAAFERSLVTPDTAFDRFLDGDAQALNAARQRGMRIFQDAGCIQCHGGPMFSDFKLHFIGGSDSTPDGLREFRTPTLRNLRHTAPYMHNGSLRTVRDVLIFYDELAEAVTETLEGGNLAGQPPLDPLLKHLNLLAEDFPALEAFLDSLSSDTYDQTMPTRVPSGLPVNP